MAGYLEMRNITKKFSGNVVLDNVNFSVDKGQVHALIGENGSGKTTLMNILAGLYTPDKGEIFINGEKVTIDSPIKAQNLGISMIHQELRVFPDLTVAENIFIKREPLKKAVPLPVIDWVEAYRETERYLKCFNLNINPRVPVGYLSYGQQRFVEIIKAISCKADLLIMDETTSALTEKEIQMLFETIREIKKLGVTVIYITHRLGEVKQIADAVTVLRDGKVVCSSNADKMNMNEIVQVMAGRKIEDRYPKIKVKMGGEVLRVQNLNYEGILHNINLDLRKGEILGIAGLSGAGRKTLAKVLFGINTPFDGTITINGKKFNSITTRTAMNNGLCYVAGTGTEESLIKQLSVARNITITNLKRVSRAGLLMPAMEAEFAADYLERLEISAEHDDIADTLSGGKQKKVALAKWLFNNARILIMDEPTAGIDIGSKVDIYNIINELVLSGASVIMISSDFAELSGMCDRVAVMYNGEIIKILNKDEISSEKILFYAAGGSERDL
ncbi:MAG TPA: sugar ABC transporter ATP-binding protein [Clostridiales bacterium]|nr:sugar ABC transporter ATP-binding protein [Clostridiales bacterium]